MARLRTLAGLEARRIRRFRVSVERHHLPPPAPNVLEQHFVTTALNRVWVGDITAVPTQAGWLYVAVLLDLYSRRVIGWAMSAKPDQQLTLEALAWRCANDASSRASSITRIGAPNTVPWRINDNSRHWG